MFADNAPLINTMLGLAATFLGLSIFVQIFQEIYKYLTTSKDRAYFNFLVDVLGPWATQLRKSSALTDLMIRGPFQFFRKRPTGKLLPLDKDELLKALERTLPPLERQTLQKLEIEQNLQDGEPQAPSATWIDFLEELKSLEEDAPGYLHTQEVTQFLEDWGCKIPGKDRIKEETPKRNHSPEEFDAKKVLLAFRQKFVPLFTSIEENFQQLITNFDYSYRRRNMRQTFIIGLLVAIFFTLPFGKIYNRASELSPAQALELADRTLGLYQAYQAQFPGPDSLQAAQGIAQAQPDSSILQQLEFANQILLAEAQREGSFIEIIDWNFVSNLYRSGWLEIFEFIAGCFLTALFVSFGAPFWNDLLGALKKQQSGKQQSTK